MALNKRFQSSDNSFPSNTLRMISISPRKRSVYLRKVGKLSPDHKLSHSKRQQTSQLALWSSGIQANSRHKLDCGSPGSKTTAITIWTVVLRDPRQQPSYLGLWFSGFQDNSRHNLDCGSPRSKTTAVTNWTVVLRFLTQQLSPSSLVPRRRRHNTPSKSRYPH